MSDDILEEYYCMNCGTAQKKNTVYNKKKGDRIISCGDCGIVLRFYVMQPPTKTNEEADESFSKTPLTDRQETGRANTGKYKRKRRTKKK